MWISGGWSSDRRCPTGLGGLNQNQVLAHHEKLKDYQKDDMRVEWTQQAKAASSRPALCTQ